MTDLNNTPAEPSAPALSVVAGSAVLNPQPLVTLVVQDAMTEGERAMQDRIDAVFNFGGLLGAVAMLFEKLWQPSKRELTRRWETGQYRAIRPNTPVRDGEDRASPKPST